MWQIGEENILLRSKIKTLLLAGITTILAVSLIIMPQESFNASIRGVNMWWEVVFPSLLPFFIITEILIGFGVVRFIGVLLEPLMRPLFRVPGVGGFVWAMGMASGFPAGAKYTARLREEKQLTRIEAERLVSFTNASNPLFIFAAVSVGFFDNARLGILLAVSHYLSNICVGLIMRFYGTAEEKEEVKEKGRERKGIKGAFSVLHQTRLKEKRPIGKLLGDAVTSSIHTLLMIGGFIIIFSVINKMLYHLQVTPIIAKGISAMFQMISFPEQLSLPFISGMFEITIGSQMTSSIDEATLLQQAIVTSFILGFTGFSIQAQVASILAQTDIRFKPFFFARIIQGFCSAIFTFILWTPIYKRFAENQPSNSVPVFQSQGEQVYTNLLLWLKTFGPLITIIALVIYICIYARTHFKPQK
jgi:sporulation integral membrane protein YlbJ